MRFGCSNAYEVVLIYALADFFRLIYELIVNCTRFEFRLIPFLLVTKRYAFLAIGNVRNFQKCQQESVAVRAYSVNCLLHLLTKVILTTSD